MEALDDLPGHGRLHGDPGDRPDRADDAPADRALVAARDTIGADPDPYEKGRPAHDPEKCERFSDKINAQNQESKSMLRIRSDRIMLLAALLSFRRFVQASVLLWGPVIVRLQVVG